MDHLNDVTEKVGGSAKFEIKLPYEDAPVEWLHNGKRIFPEKNPQKYHVITNGLSKILVINDLKKEEQGTMGIKIGEKTSTAKLQIKGLYVFFKTCLNLIFFCSRKYVVFLHFLVGYKCKIFTSPQVFPMPYRAYPMPLRAYSRPLRAYAGSL